MAKDQTRGQRSTLDERAAAAFVEASYGDLLAYCRRHGPRGCAEDLAQEAFCRLVRQRPDLDAEDARAYLFAIARNLCIDEGRACARRPVTVPLSEGPEAADPRDEMADAELALALESLAAPSREIIELRFDAGLSTAEIAVVLGASRFAAHRRLRRALNELRDVLLTDAPEKPRATARRHTPEKEVNHVR